MKKVEIVTPVHNRRELTLQFLQSLSQIDRTDLEIHIIVVDDGSTDGTPESVRRQFPKVEIIKGDGNLWYTAGTNLGIKTALNYSPDYILTVNNDCVFDKNFLKKMIQCAEKYRRSVIGAVLLHWDNPEHVFQISPKWETLGGGWKHWNQQTIHTIPEKTWEVGIIVGNCVLYPIKAITEAGFMNEKSFVQYGDAEYTPRMKKNGWKLLIEPEARVFCKPNDIPPRIRQMPFKKMINALLIEETNVHSLKRKLQSNLSGAPNRFEGLISFAIFGLRAMLGLIYKRNIDLKKEKPLSETFAHTVMRD